MAAEKAKPSDRPAGPKVLQEAKDQSQECRDPITTLPNEHGWVVDQMHQFQGFWYFTKVMQGVLNCQKHFQPYDSDIFLATLPKSGTTWLKALTFAVLNRTTYSPNLDPADPTRTHHLHPLLTANPHDLMPCLELDIYLEDIKPDLSSFSPPSLFASHLSYVSLPESVKKSRCKIVYLCREPKDVFVSLLHFANKFRTETRGALSIEDSFNKFCQGVSPFGPFWDHMLGYYKESLARPEKIMFLRFEELKSKPVKVLKDLAEFIGYGFSKEEENGDVMCDILRLCSFETLSNLEVNKSGTLSSGVENKFFFRRGEVGDWKNFLTLDMIERLSVITEEKLGKHGFKF